MNLIQTRAHFRALRTQVPKDSNDEMTYTNVLISLDNAHDETEALGYLRAQIENCFDRDRSAIYQNAVALLQQA